MDSEGYIIHVLLKRFYQLVGHIFLFFFSFFIAQFRKTDLPLSQDSK